MPIIKQKLQELLSKVFRRKYLKGYYRKLILQSEPDNPNTPFKNKNILIFMLSFFLTFYFSIAAVSWSFMFDVIEHLSKTDHFTNFKTFKKKNQLI